MSLLHVFLWHLATTTWPGKVTIAEALFHDYDILLWWHFMVMTCVSLLTVMTRYSLLELSIWLAQTTGWQTNYQGHIYMVKTHTILPVNHGLELLYQMICLSLTLVGSCPFVLLQKPILLFSNSGRVPSLETTTIMFHPGFNKLL